jgi:thiamine-phosphate pyrophosphorylase
MFATRTHPEMRPLPRMRAAALVRLTGRKAIALGGMNESRFRQVRALGFQGWAGIDAWTARIRT